MSNSIFEKINIFYLLGIEALPKDEETKYITDMTRIVMGNGLADALKKEQIPTEVFNKLITIIEEDKESPKASDGIKVQRYVMDNIPNIKDYIVDASNQFKAEAFEDQLKLVEGKLSTITDETERNYFADLIKKIRINLQNNEESNFFENHKLYTDLKVKYKLD